jgi:hypothetical protein
MHGMFLKAITSKINKESTLIHSRFLEELLANNRWLQENMVEKEQALPLSLH